jgi:hypothetical protein
MAGVDVSCLLFNVAVDFDAGSCLSIIACGVVETSGW